MGSKLAFISFLLSPDFVLQREYCAKFTSAATLARWAADAHPFTLPENATDRGGK
jgi:hypothetical protein